MKRTSIISIMSFAALAILASGCASTRVSFASIARPDRSPELEAYNVFVGKWAWKATTLNAEGPGAEWSGTAEWNWTLDQRALHGTMSAQSDSTRFEAAGVWSWHPKDRKHIWWMFNNWGYPQEGTANFDADHKSWRMNYKSVGLDGTTSYGLYNMTAVDNNTLSWRSREWADPFHMILKVEMIGTYTRIQ